MKDRISNYLGSLLVIGAAFCFGLMPVFTKISYSGNSNAYTVCVFRFSIAAFCFLIINLVTPKVSLKLKKDEFKAVLLMSVFYAVTPMLLYSSYEMISSALASSLHFTYPLWVILLMMILFREKLSVKQIICTLLCMAGMILLYTPGSKGTVPGMILAVLSGLTYASYVVTLGRSKLDIKVTVLSFYISLFAAIELWIPCTLMGLVRFDLTSRGWFGIVGLSIFSTVFPLVLFQLGIRRCSEIQASLLSTFEPVTGVLFGIFFFHELVTYRLMTGIILILLSTVILVLKKKNSKHI